MSCILFCSHQEAIWMVLSHEEEEISKECWASILPDKIKSCIALRVTQLNIVSIADCMHFALGLYPWQYTKWIQLNAIATIEPWGQILLTNWVCLRGTGQRPHSPLTDSLFQPLLHFIPLLCLYYGIILLWCNIPLPSYLCLKHCCLLPNSSVHTIAVYPCSYWSCITPSLLIL